MKHLSLDALRAFVTIIDAGGVARAGDVLGRSQPAISMQIKRLEEQLNKKLFVRDGQRIVANQNGQALYDKARELLALNDGVFHQFAQTSLKGRIRLGIPSEFATSVLPGIIGDFSVAYPDVALEVTSALSKQLLRENNDSPYDLILALKETRGRGASLMQDELVWVGAPHYKADTTPLPLVLAPDGCIYRKRALDKLKLHNRAYRIGYTNADISGIAAALRAGLGLTVLARGTVPDGLAVISHPELPRLGRVAIELMNQHTQDNPAVNRLADFIRRRLG